MYTGISFVTYFFSTFRTYYQRHEYTSKLNNLSQVICLIIPFFSNVVNHGEDGWSTIFDKISNKAIISDSFKNFADAVDTIGRDSVKQSGSWVNYAKRVGNTDKQLIKFLSDVDSGTRNIEDIGSYMENLTASTSSFASTLKTVSLNVGTMLAVSLAIKAAAYACDKLNITVDEEKEKLKDLTNTLSDLQSEYDSLSSRSSNSLSKSEKEHLKYLEDRIELEKELIELQKNQVYREQIGGGFTDLFDKDSYTHKLAFSQNEYEASGFVEGSTETRADEIDRLIAKYKELNKAKSDFENIPINPNNEESISNALVENQQKLFLAEGELKAAYDQALLYLNEQQSEFDDLQEILDSGVDNKTKSKAKDDQDVYAERIASAKKYINELSNLFNTSPSVAQVIKEKTSLVEEEVTFSDSIKNIKSATEALDALSQMYKNISSSSFNLESLADDNFVSTFSQYTDEFQNFVDTVTNSPSNINACQSAFDDLASAWVNGSGVLDDLSDENKDYAIALLEAKGIANAAEIVVSQLNKEKIQQAIVTGEATNKTNAEIAAIISENTGLQLNAQLIRAVAIAKETCNGTSLSFTNDINSIIAFAKSLGGSITALSMYNEARNVANNASAHWSGMSDVAAAAKQEVQSALDSAFDLNIKPVAYSGGGLYSGGGSSSSKVDPYIAEIDALRDYIAAYEDAQAKREAIDKKYDNADTNQEKLALMRERISAMEEEQKAIEALNEARDKEIQKNVDELKSKGFEVEYDPYTDKLQISNLEHLNELKGKDQEKTNDLIKKYEELINDTEDMAEANRDLAVTWQDNIYSLSDYNDEILELIESMHDEEITDIEFKIAVADELNRTEDKLGLFSDALKATIQDLDEAYAMGLDNTSDYVQKLIKEIMGLANKIKDTRKDMYEEKRDGYDAAKSAVVNQIENNIKALEEQKEELQAINDEQDRALKLSQLKENLSKAKQNKVIHIYRKGFGWVYEPDEEAIREAQKDLADFENEDRINAIDKEIKRLEDYKKLWEDIPNKWQEAADKMKASELFGDDWEDRVNDLTLDVEGFGDMYYDVCQNIHDATKATVQDILDEYSGLFKNLNLNNALDPTETTRNVRYFYATLNGEAPNGAAVGDRILTTDGTYEIVASGKNTVVNDKDAKYNETTGFWSKRVQDERNLHVALTDLNQGTYAYTKTITDLDDRVILAGNKIDSSTSTISRNSTIIGYNTSSTNASTNAISDNTDGLEENTNEIGNVQDYVAEGIKEGAPYIQKAIANGTYVIDGGVILNGTMSNPSDNLNNIINFGTSLDDNGNPIPITKETMDKAIEDIGERLGKDSAAYKAANDYRISLFGEKGDTVSGINANKNAGYSSGAYYDSYDDYFNSYNAQYRGMINGKKWYEYVDSHGHTTAANEDYFKTDYIWGHTSGYTDRERASKILQKMEETNMFNDMLKSYHDATMRMLDIVNTPLNGSVKETTAIRENAQRAYNEIRDSKNGKNNSVGTYDSSGKKVVSVSYNRKGEKVNTSYSNIAIDLSGYVDDVDGKLDGKDVYNSSIFNAFSDWYHSGNSYIDVNKEYPESNVDTIRAYDTSYNQKFDSLKISTDKNANETRTNSEILKDNTNAMDTLGDVFGEEMGGLKDAVGDAVEVIDKFGNTIGTINTSTGSLYIGGGSSSGSSSSRGSSSNRGTLSSDGTYRNSYSSNDITAIKNAQAAYKKAEANNDTAGMKAAHDAAESIRNKYGDSSSSTGIIKNSSSSSKNSSSSKGTTTTVKDSKGNSVTTTKNSSNRTTTVVVKRKHAKGTGKIKNAHWGIVDDAGTELIMRSDTNGRETYLEYGDRVFPHNESQAILDTYTKMKYAPEDLIPVKIPEIFKTAQIQSDIITNVHPDMFTGANTLAKSLNNISKVQQSSNIVYQYDFDKLVLPNVHNGNELIMQLRSLSSDALQRSYKR